MHQWNKFVNNIWVSEKLTFDLDVKINGVWTCLRFLVVGLMLWILHCLILKLLCLQDFQKTWPLTLTWRSRSLRQIFVGLYRPYKRKLTTCTFLLMTKDSFYKINEYKPSIQNIWLNQSRGKKLNSLPTKLRRRSCNYLLCI